MSNSNTSSRTRVCSECGGPISFGNQSGICAKNTECRSKLQAFLRGHPCKEPKTVWLLEPAYEIDEDGNKILDDNGNYIEIIDEVAIRVTVAGSRRVPLTEKERDLAILQMIDLNFRYRDIANHLGTSPSKLKPLVEKLGFQVIPRRQTGSTALRGATEIRKVTT